LDSSSKEGLKRGLFRLVDEVDDDFGRFEEVEVGVLSCFIADLVLGDSGDVSTESPLEATLLVLVTGGMVTVFFFLGGILLFLFFFAASFFSCSATAL
jgi:hypothetical protein